LKLESENLKLTSIFLATVILASCAGNDQSSSSSSQPGRRSLTERLSGERGYAQDSEGNWIAKSNKRSFYETKGTPNGLKGEYNTGQYKTGEFAKKSWWTPDQVERKSFDNVADGSRFQKNSNLAGKGARESGSDAGLAKNFGTKPFATTSAREATGDRIDKPSDPLTDYRRRVFNQPDDNIDWREQRSLSVDQTRGMTGR